MKNSGKAHSARGLAAALLLGGLLLLPSLWFDVGADQAHYNYVAWAWLEHGLPPCRSNDTCDLPGIIFVSLAALKLFGYKVISLRLFDFFVQLVNLGLIFCLARLLQPGRQNSRAGILASALYALAYLGLGHWNTAQRDGFALPFLLASALVYLKAPAGFRRSGVLLAGLMTGMAFLMKPTLGLWGVLLAGLYLRSAGKHKRGWGATLAEQLLLLTSALAPLLLTALVYARSGAGFDFWKECWVYLTQVYSQKQISAGTEGILNRWLFAPVYLALSFLKRDQVLWLGTGLYFLRALWPGESQEQGREASRALVLLLLVCVFSFFVQGSDLAYHKIPLLGLAAIFAGGLFSGLLDEYGRARGIFAKLAPAAATLILLGLELLSFESKALHFLADSSFRNLHTAYMNQEPRFHRVAEYIQSHTTPDQYVGSIGFSPALFLARRLTPTRYSFFSAILIKDKSGDYHPLLKKWQAEFCEDLRRNSPPYVLAIDLVSEVSCLKQLLAEEYSLETVIEDLRGLSDRSEPVYIYRKK